MSRNRYGQPFVAAYAFLVPTRVAAVLPLFNEGSAAADLVRRMPGCVSTTFVVDDGESLFGVAGAEDDITARGEQLAEKQNGVNLVVHDKHLLHPARRWQPRQVMKFFCHLRV